MSLAELQNIVDQNKDSIALIKVIKDKYNDFLLSDQFDEDTEYNGELFNAMAFVLGFIRDHSTLTFNKIESNNE